MPLRLIVSKALYGCDNKWVINQEKPRYGLCLGKIFKEQNQLKDAIAAFQSLKDLYEEMGEAELVRLCDAVLEQLFLNDER